MTWWPSWTLSWIWSLMPVIKTVHPSCFYLTRDVLSGSRVRMRGYIFCTWDHPQHQDYESNFAAGSPPSGAGIGWTQVALLSRLPYVQTVWEGMPVAKLTLMPGSIAPRVAPQVGVPDIIKPSFAGTEGWSLLSVIMVVYSGPQQIHNKPPPRPQTPTERGTKTTSL